MAHRVETSTTRYDEKLKLILKTSARIFAEKGFHRTSIRDIARATRMSLAGLYYYFRTKDELLYLIQEQCFLTLLHRWEKARQPDLDVRARIRMFAENHLRFFFHNADEMKVMAHEDESLTGQYQERILVLKRRYVKILQDLIAEFQAPEGGKGLDFRVATFSLFGMMNWIYTWYRPRRDLPLDELVDHMLRVYFFGILKGSRAEESWFSRSASGAERKEFSLWQDLP